MRRTVRLRPSNTGTTAILELEVNPGGHFVLTAGEDTLAGDLEATPSGGCLRLDGKVVPFYAAQTGGELHLWLEGYIYRFELEAAEDDGPTGAAGPVGASGEIIAPMPGRVVQLHATPGARVTSGEILVVVESMKVQFNVPASVDGIVAEVRTEVGRIVELGDVLVRLEALTSRE